MNESPLAPDIQNQEDCATWLSHPIPGKWESIRKWATTRVETLFDGAYLGFIGEPILTARFDEDLGMMKILEEEPPRNKIMAINPGAKKVSRLLPLYLLGQSLALTKGKGYEKINHVEAENAKLVREVKYEEIFRYLGDKGAAQILSMSRIAVAALQQSFPDSELAESKLESAYQVTKEGVKNGLLLVDAGYRSSGRSPFSGGSGSLRHRKPATV